MTAAFRVSCKVVDPSVSIDWLDPLLRPFLATAILVTDVKHCVI